MLIPVDFIAEWRGQAAWTEQAQVEQDLVISRALVEIFQDDDVAGAAPGSPWSLAEAARWVADELVARLPGEPWKRPGGSGDAGEG